jgi:hypothetical protein
MKYAEKTKVKIEFPEAGQRAAAKSAVNSSLVCANHERSD